MKRTTVYLMLAGILISAGLLGLFIKLRPGESQSSRNQEILAPLTDADGEASSSEGASPFNVIWSADFQNQETGVFDFRDIKKEFGSDGSYEGRGLAGVGSYMRSQDHMNNDQNISIEIENGNKFTRNWFRGGQYGIVTPRRPEGSGHMYHPEIPGNHEELWISHNIRWPEDRDWAQSGKIGFTVTGGISPGGCNPYQPKKHNGFIINLMWSKAQEMKLYMYWAGKDEKLYPCGLSGPFKWMDPNKPGQNLILTDYPDQWHNITLRVVLNDRYEVGNTNGTIEAFWDGKIAFRVDTLRLRTEPGVFIDHARSYFNHGGNDDRFAPAKDTYYDCDDVWTWTWKEGSGLPTGFTPWDASRKVPLPNYPKSN